MHSESTLGRHGDQPHEVEPAEGDADGASITVGVVTISDAVPTDDVRAVLAELGCR